MIEYSLEEVNEFFRNNPDYFEYLNEFKIYKTVIK